MLQSQSYPSSLCLLLLLLIFLPPSSDSANINSFYLNCSKYSHCGELEINISYPFRLLESPNYCGYPGYELNCSLDDESHLSIKLEGNDYAVRDINYEDGLLVVVNSDFIGSDCPLITANTNINLDLFSYTKFDLNLTLYLNCSFPKLPELLEIPCLSNTSWKKKSYYQINYGSPIFVENLPSSCDLTAVVPVYDFKSVRNFQDLLAEGFELTWNLHAEWCQECMNSGGICGYYETKPRDHICFCHNTTSLDTCYTTKKRNKGLIIGLSLVGGLSTAIACFLCFLYAQRKKRNRPNSTLNGIASFHPFFKSDSEASCSLHAPIFHYDELYEATNGFDESRELGDGGFGTVYKGKLRDGRVVAVKRLYESNYRRVEQFMNEVKILSLLRHQNLVNLYGCTSRHSRELLLVYEFVPNGTVAGHLHGKQASEAYMPWQARLNIAIETADAVAYLHSVEPQIIHRDIKTDNLLLDNSFHIKVADFGLSRLFPVDATHVSTAPQGTPGYVDPEYYQCYQLTEKSDVYSFGVVLAELISSKPAVDITRQRNEINLSTMAVGKIQRQELHELVDQKLGYQSDCNIKRMIDQVAEVAFRCLQSDGEMRPSIKDVLEILTGIKSGGQKTESFVNANVAFKEEAQLMKSSFLYSPNSVAEGWASRGTTPNSSG